MSTEEHIAAPPSRADATATTPTRRRCDRMHAMTNDRHAKLVDPAPSAPRTAATDLVARLATVPGLVRPGVSSWDMKTRLPLHPLAVESAYGDPRLLHALAIP